MAGLLEMELVDVRVERTTNSPIIVLRVKDGSRRILPIFIGVPEATAIKIGMEGQVTPRPLTHDLILDLLRSCGATVRRVVVTELRENIFYADLHLELDGKPVIVSSRPSDAVAVAVRAGAPIYADEELVAANAVEAEQVGEETPENADELVDEFRRFIEEINPEDFGA